MTFGGVKMWNDEEMYEEISDEDYRLQQLDNDEISWEEEAFLKGYEEAYL